MRSSRLDLAGTYEFFSLSDATDAADRGRLPPGAVVVVGGAVYVAMWYDDEKRVVLKRASGGIPRDPILTAPQRRSKRKGRWYL